jgi:hypothetical protein
MTNSSALRAAAKTLLQYAGDGPSAHNLRIRGLAQYVLDSVKEWQPIETAPKDCDVLVYAAESDGLPGFITISRWHSDAGFCVCEIREATHWQPLPPPPLPGEKTT